MILVTGATGRIGRHLVKALLERKEKVRILSRKKIPEKKNLEVAAGDLLDKNSLKKAVKGIDTIYHLAAIVDYTAPKKLIEKVNIDGTKNLLEVSKGKKIIYLSSTAVYGKKIKMCEIGKPANETSFCKPTNFYGLTKLKAEKLVLEKGGIVIRSADVYGPGFEEGYFYVFDELEKRKLPIIGDGKNKIQYIHIADLVQALILAKEKGRKKEIYIAAGAEVKTQEELLKLICKLLGIPAVKKHLPKEVAKFLAKVYLLKSRIKKQRPKLLPEYIDKLSSNRFFSIEKARKELGFEPRIGYEEGIKEMAGLWKKKNQTKKRKMPKE